MNIELDALSGRPNPTWPLTLAEATELQNLLRDLSLAPAPAPARPTEALGYRGFLIHRSQVGGASAEPVRVVAGTVSIGPQVFEDQRGAEAWLMRSAREHGWAAIVDSLPKR